MDSPPRQTTLLALYLAGAAGLAAWWLVGQAMLWRLTRTARAVGIPVRDLFSEISGPRGEPVVLLETDHVALPFTFTWLRPVILLPRKLCYPTDAGRLRYILRTRVVAH